MPNMPLGLNANFGDQLYLNAGNDAPVNDPLADQAAPAAAPETETSQNSDSSAMNSNDGEATNDISVPSPEKKEA